VISVREIQNRADNFASNLIPGNLKKERMDLVFQLQTVKYIAFLLLGAIVFALFFMLAPLGTLLLLCVLLDLQDRQEFKYLQMIQDRSMD
jgi:hypothetical protein